MNPKYNFRDITIAKGGLQVCTSSYWICENGDPKKALFFGDSPQCNDNKKICEWSLDNKIYPDEFRNLSIVFIETAFVPIRY